jgi:signal transduction histidine kinase
MELYIEDFSLPALVHEVVATAEPLIRKKDNQLQVRANLPFDYFRADVTKLRQCLLNLLSNAAKFTEGGCIELDLSCQINDDQEWLKISVIDSGIGMNREQIGRLFEAFTQADASTTRKYGGTGLGLALSRRFCQMMGGDITVDSAPGQGSTFTIRLPAIGVQTAATPAI